MDIVNTMPCNDFNGNLASKYTEETNRVIPKAIILMKYGFAL